MSRGVIIYSNVYIIQRGAFALLVSTFRAMRRPYTVERATKHRLHVSFCACPNLKQLNKYAIGAKAELNY